MKKIFALVLALAMVASMGAASAMSCLNIDWTSATKCGVGTVEVIPYVLNNSGGGMVSYTANDCAGAVNTQWIYYAIRVTVQEDPNQNWWDSAKLEVTLGDGLAAGFNRAPSSAPGIGATYITNLDPDPITGWAGTTATMNAGGNGNAETVDGELWRAKNGAGPLGSNRNVSAGTYYLANYAANAGTVAAGDWTFTTSFNPTGNLFAARVLNTSGNVQVCAKLSSSDEITGTGMIDINGWNVALVGTGYNAWNVFPAPMSTTFTTAGYWGIDLVDGLSHVTYVYDGTTFKGMLVTTDGLRNVNYYQNFRGDAYTGTKLVVNGAAATGADVNAVADAACLNNSHFALIQSAATAINLPFGTSGISLQTAQSKLQWDGKSEDCHTWGSAATAIVDTNCVIEIPKTGDVSVVAYAVMALVTAAGALKFRK